MVPATQMRIECCSSSHDSKLTIFGFLDCWSAKPERLKTQLWEINEMGICPDINWQINRLKLLLVAALIPSLANRYMFRETPNMGVVVANSSEGVQVHQA